MVIAFIEFGSIASLCYFIQTMHIRVMIWKNKHEIRSVPAV